MDLSGRGIEKNLANDIISHIFLTKLEKFKLNISNNSLENKNLEKLMEALIKLKTLI